MGVYDLGEGRGYAAFIGVNHYLARADHPRGPWTIQSSHENSMRTPTSHYNENAIVTPLTDPDGGKGFIACFDTVFRESIGFGIQYSADGLDWFSHNGTTVLVHGGMRTPLGLLQEPDGGVSLLFTRRFPDCSQVYNRPYIWWQYDNSGGFGSSAPSMCANIYAARFDIVWHDLRTGRIVRDNASVPVYMGTSSILAPGRFLLLAVVALALQNSRLRV
eukprot:gnl/TRDRNA2_/TRDRNA2_82263_c0_seq2.p1 gnl/TRDRNA2_/TRDRNA2_82263_c0~~gnl/TRDRNA2_/TRDRNA2_82263_c0_seq2.p1  ORF type:complete len:218 (+),score=14.99 gnl/TRDRNA2_/TRDRNA2_82263_c0_seq2:250-903(+)